ncbi:MAG: succinate dehydrogenase, cytochrome b556 subunit [Pseudomonadota bacterium]
MAERPLSPHLQIYKPQLTSVMSIMHRGTGVFLALGTVLVVYWLYSLAAGPEAFATAQGLVVSLPGKLVLLALAFSVFYHLGNGVRHLLWDAGWALELQGAYQTGWAVVVFAVLATAGSAVLIFGGGA